MKKLAQRLLRKLDELEGSGQFATTDTVKFKYPGLHVEGVGELGFPLNPVQMKALIGVARKAPFGKGSQTVTDPNVRSAWEIDASKLRFEGDEWLDTMAKILKKTAKGLGLKPNGVLAAPYKMLVYEPGDFFLPHKDSEKAKGMFGTLVVGLPCNHEGGELLIRFGGKEVVADFSTQKGAARIPFAAFFADCEHEIRPLKAGHRVCLTFNLIQEGVAQPLTLANVEAEVEALAAILKEMKPHFDYRPKAVLLQHEYTPANFSPDHLKGEDGPKQQVLAAAAERAGYFTRLGLVTHYQMGDLEVDYSSRRGRRSYSYYDDEDTDIEDGEMGDIHEEYSQVEHWAELPGLGELDLEEGDIITDKPLGEGEPSEKAAEGYTGNAGMTMEYWYHYGAVVLWPKEQHRDILGGLPLKVQLTWLNYYTSHWDTLPAEDRHRVRETLESALEHAPEPVERSVYHYDYDLEHFLGISKPRTETTFDYAKEDYSPVAMGLAHLNDEAWVAAQAPHLKKVARCIDPPSWEALLVRYGTAPFTPALKSLMQVKSEGNIAHLLKVLAHIDTKAHPALHPFVTDMAERLPAHLHDEKLTDKSHATGILDDLLTLSPLMSKKWCQVVAKILTKNATRPYVNQHLVPAVQQQAHKGSALQALLRQFCMDDLARRTAQKPAPPTDWTRQVPPQAAQGKGVWNILRTFMASPTDPTYDYVAKEADRNQMESSIKAAKLDLDMETIRQGRPYTLRLKKNSASYERALAEWKEDVALLGRLG